MEALENIKSLKSKLNDQQLTEDLRHNYIYSQLRNSMVEKEGLIKKRTEVLPEVTTFPKIDKVYFSLPEKPNERYDNKNPIPKSLKFVNENQKDSLEKMKVKVNIFDADYLNQINSKRIDDLKEIDDHHKSKSVIQGFLDRESSAAQINLHQSDAINELMSQDILLPLDGPNVDNYETPLRVTNKFSSLASLE